MFDFIGDAWDSFTGLFGGDEGATSSDGWKSNDDGWDYDFKGKPEAYQQFESDYSDNGILDGDYSSFEGADLNPSNNGGGFGKALLSPSVLGAIVTSGAGLLQGMNQMDIQKQQLKAAEEQRKMNQMLELAKLKYQLLGKGGSGGSGRRYGGSGGANPSAAINAQASANLANGYQALGGSLSSIYR